MERIDRRQLRRNLRYPVVLHEDGNTVNVSETIQWHAARLNVDGQTVFRRLGHLALEIVTHSVLTDSVDQLVRSVTLDYAWCHVCLLYINHAERDKRAALLVDHQITQHPTEPGVLRFGLDGHTPRRLGPPPPIAADVCPLCSDSALCPTHNSNSGTERSHT